MESRKRKTPQIGLQRRVRARAEPDPDLDVFEDEMSDGAPSEAEVDESGSDSKSGSGSGSGSGSESGDESDKNDESSEEEDAKVDASKVSFGALAKAQAAIGRRKKEADGAEDAPGEEAAARPDYTYQYTKIEKPPSRSSKHAPMEMSSKRQVSRKREIIPVRKVQHRDPRFDPLVTGQALRTQTDEDRARRAYAFLDEYRDDEMKQLRAAIRKAKTPAEKEELQRALMSMESRKKARAKREKERAVVEEHRKREKELVKEGVKAKPFYLKKSEQKKRLLVDQFTGLSERQRDKAIEKKRKKIAGKEKKQLPMERRARE
ncbi:rRNA biogenesis protein RRP36 [Cytospora mali]|uniref:rRNA biogenesis protein RRP36 n=1 Tax=Cytospora mali TaxID=578113 RepID=A0A194W519_CYTMA|nr:rRNA biogenesis protein RRP36 [Valsa mali]